MAIRTLRFNLYSIHGHLPEGTPDYTELIRELTFLKGRHTHDRTRLIAIGAAHLTRTRNSIERLSLTVYSGDPEKIVLYFDINEQTEFSSLLQSGRFVAKKTHLMIDPHQRTLIIETGRSHPPAEELAEFIEASAQELPGFEGLDLSFTPIAAPAFISKINEMQRIQAVSVSIARPNPNWSDRYDQLRQMADDSSAHSIDATVRARRNGSLSKQSGLVPSLKHWLSESLPSVSTAKIKGEYANGAGLVELRLSDHVETVNVQTELDQGTGLPKDTDIEEKLNALLDERAEAQ
jgi:hypothetical protein